MSKVGTGVLFKTNDFGEENYDVGHNKCHEKWHISGMNTCTPLSLIVK